MPIIKGKVEMLLDLIKLTLRKIRYINKKKMVINHMIMIDQTQIKKIYIINQLKKPNKYNSHQERSKEEAV